MALDHAARADLLGEALARADTADRFRKRMGRTLHPGRYGALVQELMSVVAPADPRWIDGTYLECNALLCEVLTAWKKERRLLGRCSA